jgi:hypothetical protein
MDMRFCINNLDAITAEAGDFSLKDFSDYWAPDNGKTAPSAPNAFIPSRLVSGNNPLWASYYSLGETRLDADGSEEADTNFPPYFWVSLEIIGRMLHTFKKSYVDSDERRKTDSHLSGHINANTEHLKARVADAVGTLRDRKDDLLRRHDEAMAASQQQMADASRVYKETVGKHIESLQQSLQGTSSLAQGLKEEADKLKKRVLSTHVVPSLKLDDKELGYVKQLKELQREHGVLRLEYERLQESKEGAVKQLNTAREVNREASQLIADLEERNNVHDQNKLVLEQKQVKLEKEVETLKRKRRNTPSPPPGKSAPTPTLRILRRGEKESPAAMETTLSPSSLPPPKKSRNRSKRWDQPAPGQEKKVPSLARTPDNVNGKRLQEQGTKNDPVLYASLNSFRNKKDVEEELHRSSKSLGHGSKGSEEVFHRMTLSH